MNLQSWILLAVVAALAIATVVRLRRKHKAAVGACSSCNATGCALRAIKEKQARNKK